VDLALIPYIHIPSYKLFGLLPIQPFGVLVGIALVVGYMLGRRRARLTGLDPQHCADGQVWAVVAGFVMAHLVSVIFYFPEKILNEPWVLLMVWAGLSSFGGFVGGIVGLWAYCHKHKLSMLKYTDAILFGFVPAWIIGRMGCSVVHDHPGKNSMFWLAVNFPVDAHNPLGPRHDLGFYEMLVACGLTVILYALKKVRPFDGFHPALILFLYAPVRFLLDYLRIQDKTYLGLTPGQYFAVGMFALAIVLTVRGIRQRQREAAA